MPKKNANQVPYVFFGSSPIGPIALEVLTRHEYEPAAVITDTSLTTDEQVEIVERAKAGFILVVGYGAILKRDLLDSVAGQALNIHPSLLPEYRGPAPVVQTILDAPSETGVTLIEIDTKMDHGPIIAQETQPLHGRETPDELYRVLTEKGVRLFLENIDAYLKEDLDPLPQEHDMATFTHFIKKEDGLLDFTEEPELIERKVRAYKGWPGTWTVLDGKRLIIHAAHMHSGELRIDEVQPEGGKRMQLSAFLLGKRMTEADFYAALGI